MKLLLGILLVCMLVCIPAKDPFPDEDYEAELIELAPGEEVFYWHFRARHHPKKDPLVIWISGGPGCSSEFSLYYEHGPEYHLSQDADQDGYTGSWNEIANMIYLDLPLGTGFSKTRKNVFNAWSKNTVVENFYSFFLKFLDKHPEYKKRPLYIMAESYAGHYIPPILEYLIDAQNPDINLISSAIGSGWVDPYHQYPEYLKYAKEEDLIAKEFAFALEAPLALCKVLLEYSFDFISFPVCELIPTTIIGTIILPFFNRYNVDSYCYHPPFCDDFSNYFKYINNWEFRFHFNVEDRKVPGCNIFAPFILMNDFSKDYALQLKKALENNIGVLVFNGDKDYMCNWRGAEAWTNSIPWENQTDFQNTDYEPIHISKYVETEYKKKDNLTFLKTIWAGHLMFKDNAGFPILLFEKFLNREI